jgi:hypothetical protein
MDDFPYATSLAVPAVTSDRFNVVRVGLNYRFGGDPWGKSPIVAKY